MSASAANFVDAEFAYSCQTYLNIYITESYFGGKHRVWASSSLYPDGNGYSSNPLRLYEELSVIVRTNDYNHARIRQLRVRFQEWIGPLDQSEQFAVLLEEISRAPVKAFRPELWKIDLRGINATRILDIGQFRDEIMIAEVRSTEYEVIARER